MSLVYGALAALLVIFLLAMVISRKPKFGIGLSIVTVLLIALAVFFYTGEESRLEKQKARIPVEQIILSKADAKLSYGNTYKITGNLENRSPRYMLASIILDIHVYDCSGDKKASQQADKPKQDGQDCVSLQQKQHKVDTRMLAETSKPIETYVLFDAIDEKNNNLKWGIRVISGIGK